MNELLLPERSFGPDLWEMLRTSDVPIVVYGMGNGADKLIDRLNKIGREVSDFFASDVFVRGQSFHGKRVLRFSEIKEKYEKFIILVSFGSSFPSVMHAVYSLADQYEVRIPDMPIAGDDYFTSEFYEKNYDKFFTVYHMLADEASKRVFAELILYKLTGKPAHLYAATEYEDIKALLGFATMRSAVDVGAYRGDTLKEMLAFAPQLERVFALEPDIKNFARLKAFAETVNNKEITAVNAAAWQENGSLAFSSSGNRNATLGGGEEKLAGTASYKHKQTLVKTVRIDDILNGARVDYIKYDTEGAELAALTGSRKTIDEQSPALRISVYHRSEDLFALPLWLFSLMGERYEYYLRRTPAIPAWECDLIAVSKTSV